jgi:hypothetical protein
MGCATWPKRNLLTWDWRRMNKEELLDLSACPNIMWVIKSRKNGIGGKCGMCRGREMCVQDFGGDT